MSGRLWQCAHDSTHKICLFPPRKDADVGHPYHSEYLITRKCWQTQGFLWISVPLHWTTIRKHHTLNASNKTGAPGHAQEWLYLCLLSRHCLCSEDGHQNSAFCGGQRKQICPTSLKSWRAPPTARQGRRQSIYATTEAKIMSSLNSSWWILSIHKFVRSLNCTDKLVFRATKAEELY